MALASCQRHTIKNLTNFTRLTKHPTWSKLRVKFLVPPPPSRDRQLGLGIERFRWSYWRTHSRKFSASCNPLLALSRGETHSPFLRMSCWAKAIVNQGNCHLRMSRARLQGRRHSISAQRRHHFIRPLTRFTWSVVWSHSARDQSP